LVRLPYPEMLFRCRPMIRSFTRARFRPNPSPCVIAAPRLPAARAVAWLLIITGLLSVRAFAPCNRSLVQASALELVRCIRSLVPAFALAFVRFTRLPAQAARGYVHQAITGVPAVLLLLVQRSVSSRQHQ
jgi:hypothetical protein